MEYFSSHEMFKSSLSKYFSKEAPKFIKQVKAPKKADKPAKPEKEVKPMEAMPTDPIELLKYKRDFNRSFPSAYDPDFVEANWYSWWEDNKFFHTTAQEGLSVDPSKRFVIILPPPNVTGYLHVGHALTGAIEDCMTRWRKMSGYKAVYIPGVDHAGIATQSVVEKTLLKQGITKNQLGREKFVEKVWEWKKSYGIAIEKQLRRLGSCLDWDRFSFTMDETRSRAVKEAFIRLHEKGYIYRANRLVNWSCSLKTAISDIEVESKDIKGPTKLKVQSDKELAEVGVLIEFAYKIKDSDEEIIVATTRLETMLGDVAVAVNSKDPRYTHLIGKVIVHPFVPERQMKVITDDLLVDMTFGTGAVKITPAHDLNDFECGKRNNLEFINILNDDGTLNGNTGHYQGLPRYTARRQMEEEMKKLGFFRSKKPNPMVLSICSKSGDIIEPLLKPQWYVDCKEISKKMIDVVEKGELKIIPEYRTKIWYNWLKESQDWCISRQLWWGHRVPAYKAKIVGSNDQLILNTDGTTKWFVGRSLEIVSECVKKEHPGVLFELLQDEDVLDTWFSSALLPFANFGWPDINSEDFRAYFPNTVLETGHDILFFWVARMVMMSLLLTEQLPFKTVYLHNLVRDENGEKMSKSKGNVIDPLEIIDGCTLEKILETVKNSILPDAEKELTLINKKKKFPEGIPKCGSDALRFGLLSYVSESKDINLDVKVIITTRLFCNKIWNAYKLCRSILGEDFKVEKDTSCFAKYPAPERWIVSKYEECVTNINNSLENHRYSDATEEFSNFWFYSFCDYYLEYAKGVDKSNTELFSQTRNTLFFILNGCIRLLHPMMPFLTEELYQKLPSYAWKKETILFESYPQNCNLLQNDQNSREFDLVLKTIQVVRQLTGIFSLPPNSNPPLFITLSSPAQRDVELLELYFKFIQSQAKVGAIKVIALSEVPNQCLKGIVSLNVQVHLHLKDSLKLSEESVKVNQEIGKVQEQIAKLQQKMSKPDYLTKVPEKFQKQDLEFLQNFELQIKKLNETLELIKSMS